MPSLLKPNESGSQKRAVIHVYDEAGNVIETHEQAGEFRDWYRVLGTVPTRFRFLNAE
jgi:hypothetical protein